MKEHISSSRFSYDLNSKNIQIEDSGLIVELKNYNRYSNVKVVKYGKDSSESYIGNFIGDLKYIGDYMDIKITETSWKKMVDEFTEYTGGFYIYIKDNELTMTSGTEEGGEPIWSHSGDLFRKLLAILNIYQYVLSNNNMLFYYSQVEEIDEVRDLTFSNLSLLPVSFFKSSQNIYNLVKYLLRPENITLEGLVFNTHGHIWELICDELLGNKSNKIDEMIGLSIILNIMVLSGLRYKEYKGEYAIYIPNVNRSKVGVSVIGLMKNPGERRILLPIKINYALGQLIFYNTDYMDVFDMENITKISDTVAGRDNSSSGGIAYNNMLLFISYKGTDTYQESKNGLRMVRLSSEKFNPNKEEYDKLAIRFTKEHDMGERVSKLVLSLQYFNEIDVKKTITESIAESTGNAISALTVGIMLSGWLKSFEFFAALGTSFMIGLPIVAFISTFAISALIKYFSLKRDLRYEIDLNKLIDFSFYSMSPYNSISVKGPSLLIGIDDFIEKGKDIYDLRGGETDFLQSKEYLSKFYVFSEDNKAKPVVIMDDYGLIFGVENDDADRSGYGTVSIFGTLYLTKQYNKETNNFIYNLLKAQLSSPLDIGRFNQMPKSIVRETYEKIIADDNLIRLLINAELFMLSSIQNIEYVIAEENILDAYELYRHLVIQEVRYLRYKSNAKQIAIGEGIPILVIPIHSLQNVSLLDTLATSLLSSLSNTNLLMTFSQEIIDRSIYLMSSVNASNDVRIIIQTIESIMKEDSYIYKKYKDRDYRLIGILSGIY